MTVHSRAPCHGAVSVLAPAHVNGSLLGVAALSLIIFGLIIATPALFISGDHAANAVDRDDRVSCSPVARKPPLHTAV